MFSSRVEPCGDLRDDHCDVQGVRDVVPMSDCDCTNMPRVYVSSYCPTSARAPDLDANMRAEDAAVRGRSTKSRGNRVPEHDEGPHPSSLRLPDP